MLPHLFPKFLSRLAFVVLTIPIFGCEEFTQNRISDDKVKFVSVAELAQLYDRSSSRADLLLLIDPRPAKAFDRGHIPGAMNLTLPKVPEGADRDPSIERFEHIIVYGDNPATPTAIGMVKRLLAAKYDGVRMYAGGLKEWTTRGFPVSEPVLPPESTKETSDEPKGDAGLTEPASEAGAEEESKATPAPTDAAAKGGG